MPMVYMILLAYVFIVFAFLFMSLADDLEIPKTPADIYENTKLNRTSCVIVYILWVIVNPLSLFLCFIWYLMHVGRKD